MAFRIPFNESITIEVDTAAELREVIAEFGVTLTSAIARAPKGAERTNERTNERSKSRARSVTPAPRSSADLDDDDDRAGLKTAIVTALQDGPASPKDLITKVASDKHAVTYALKRLEHAGVVRAQGTTRSRLWMLVKVNGHAHRDPLPAAKEEH